MKDGDLNEEEAREEEKNIQIAEEEKMVAQGKIAFKKPTKRENSDKSSGDDQVKKKKSHSSSKKEKQKSLLSFDEEEEEDGWRVSIKYVLTLKLYLTVFSVFRNFPLKSD